MSRAAAGVWGAISDGAGNMGAMLQRIAKEEMEREQREKAMADEKEYRTATLGLQRDQMSQQERLADRARETDLLTRGFEERTVADPQAMGALAAGAAGGPLTMGRAVMNAALPRREIAYNPERDPVAVREQRQFGHERGMGELTSRTQREIASGNNRTAITTAGIGANAQLGSARIAAASRPDPYARQAAESRETEANALAVGIVNNRAGGDPARALELVRGMPDDPMKVPIMQAIQGLMYEQGRRNLLGIGASGSDGPSLAELAQQFGSRR